MRVLVFRETSTKRYWPQLKAFRKAARRLGDDCVLTRSMTYQPCDVAVIVGLPKPRENPPPRLGVRRSVIENHKGPLVVIETQFLGRAITPKRGLQKLIAKLTGKRMVSDRVRHEVRIGLGGAFHNTADFCNRGAPPDRWEALRQRHGLEVKPWRAETADGHVLVIGQMIGDSSLQGTDIIEWLCETTTRLKALTRRRIVVRPHPKTYPVYLDRIRALIADDAQVSLDLDGRGMPDALRDCHACVTFSSSAAIEALMAGVPALTLSGANMAWPVTGHDLAEIENPPMPPREPWLHELAYAQWTLDEMAAGLPWQRLRAKIMAARR